MDNDPWAAFRVPATPEPSDDPWAAYRIPAEPAASAPVTDYGAPPPGEIIHGADRSYISDQPQISTVRPAEDPTGAATAATMNALKLRGQNEDTLGAVARNAIPLTQGATFNTGDELISAIFGGFKALTGGDFGQSFDTAQEFQRQELDRQRTEHPIGSAVGEVAGGVSSGLGLAGKGMTLVGNMANEGLRNLLPRVLAGGAEGAAYGGLTGFAGADGGVDNRTDQAARNLPLAAGLGAAAVPATDLVSLIFGRFSPLLTRDPVARGDEMLVRSMARDEQTPEQIAQAVEAAQAAGQSEYRAVDAAGRNSQRVGAMAAKTPGPARNDISQTLAARQQEQGQRIGSYVDDALGAQGPDAYATEQGIVNARRTAAQPLYDEAYKAPAPQGAFYDETLGRQSVQDAIRSAEKVAAEKQIPISDMFTEVPNPNPTKTQVLTGLVDPNGNPIMRTEVSDETIRVPTVRGWDLIKRELDAKVNQLYKAGDTTAAEAVKETRNALRGQLSTDVPKYGEALAKYADDSTSLEAIQTGRDLINARNADEAKASMRDIPENKRDLPRIGAAREIGVKLENQRAGQDKTLSFDTPNMQGKLDVLVDDPLVRAIFNQRLMRERDMVRAGRALTGGSSTYENLVDGQAVGDAGSALTALLSGNIMRAAGLAGGHALGALSRAATGMNEETATHVGQRLLSNDPQEIRSLADLFRQVQDHVHAPSLTPAVGSAGLNAPRTGNSDDRRGR